MRKRWWCPSCDREVLNEDVDLLDDGVYDHLAVVEHPLLENSKMTVSHLVVPAWKLGVKVVRK